MIVDRSTLDVLPLCDRLIESETGSITSDAEHDDITWSNELTLHVVELKTTRPVALPAGRASRPSSAQRAQPQVSQPSRSGQNHWDTLAHSFHSHVHRINQKLLPLHARLMPTAMHPWMDPHAQARLWPHDNSDIYAAFDRIFSCRGHGWANLQAAHLNLPFRGDEEFGRLHAAIRLILPILPALAAASPIMDAHATGTLDNRLAVYRTNCARVEQCTAQVIPEPVFTISEYHDRILKPLYTALAPHDPQGILQEEWANARGAIARFSRGTIEIRVLDVQECPAADIAIAAATFAVLQALAHETWSSWDTQKRIPMEPLTHTFNRTVIDADQAVITDDAYLRALGCETGSCTAARLWRHLIDTTSRNADLPPALETILSHGPLARRLLTATGPAPSQHALHQVYTRLCDCLEQGELFRG